MPPEAIKPMRHTSAHSRIFIAEGVKLEPLPCAHEIPELAHMKRNTATNLKRHLLVIMATFIHEK